MRMDRRAIDAAVRRGDIGEIASRNVAAELAERLGTLIFTPYQGVHLMRLIEQHGR